MTKTHGARMLTGLLLLAGLQGCYILDGLFEQEPPPKELPLQERCEQAVRNYILARSGTDLYKSYGFSKVLIHKPIELSELEELEAEKKSGVKTGPETDTLIRQKKEYIRINQIERTVELSHFFTLKSKPDFISVLESNYLLNDTLAVIDFSPNIILEIPVSYEEALGFYFYEYTLFLSTVYADGRKVSNEFYDFFKSRQAELAGVETKSSFLYHTLKITKQVKEAGIFDQQAIAENLVKERMTDAGDPMPEYEPRQFSPLYEKRNADKITGYYIFHKFIGRLNDTADLFVYRFDFSPWYEIESFVLMDQPFETYLNN